MKRLNVRELKFLFSLFVVKAFIKTFEESQGSVKTKI